jgi:hypothetical protein
MRPLISVTDHCYRPLIQADVFAVFLMNELQNLPNVVIGKLCKFVQEQNCFHDFFSILNELMNLTNVVIGKLGKLVHEQNCSHDFFFYFIYRYRVV